MERKGRPAKTPTICAAIKGRRRLRLRYRGEREERVVEPHIHGATARGEVLLRAWQVAGPSRSRTEPPWRMFEVARIRDIAMDDARFRRPRPDYNPEDPVITRTYCRL